MSHRFDKLDQIRHAALSSSSGERTPSPDDNNSEAAAALPPNMAFVNNNNNNNNMVSPAGRLEELKQQEAELAKQLAAVRMEKLSALRSKPLTIGIIGFGRFGQFIARTFAKHGRVVVTSRSDYTDVADAMGAKYVPLNDPTSFLQEELDVVILATSIVSFESTVGTLVPTLKRYIENGNKGPLVVDVLSVKEHARRIMLEQLPEECDILCTHPMFGPDSGKNGWHNLNFVYEKTRVDKVVFDPTDGDGTVSYESGDGGKNLHQETFRDNSGALHSIHEDDEAHIEAMDRIERFLSIWEEEGCRMVPMSCKSHDEYAANSQFITHLMGRILGAQGLSKTPIDTKGFESVLKLIDSTTADSFDLFYGLYKYNQKNSLHTIKQLQAAMEDVVDNLKLLEQDELMKQQRIRQESPDHDDMGVATSTATSMSASSRKTSQEHHQ